MKTIRAIVLLAAALSLSACAGIGKEQAASGAEFSTIAQENFSAIEEPRQIVVKDEEAWSTLWAEHNKHTQPTPVAPAVDFSTSMVVGVFLGTRPNTCYSVVVEAVDPVGDKYLLVKYREIVHGDMCGQAMTQPMHLVSVKRVDLPVKFILLQ